MNIKRLLKYVSFGAMVVVIIMMVIATIVEKVYGSHTAFAAIYHSPLFICVWALLGCAGILYLITRGEHKRVIPLFLHIAFIIILIGALVTRLSGRYGEIHLRCSEAPTSEWVTDDGFRQLFPFSLTLQEFHTEYYTGTEEASDYISVITIYDDDNHGASTHTISMNHILKYRGYRFYQASYDSDGEGSVLYVSFDPWGITITYIGYAMLLVAIVAFFFYRNSGFWRAVTNVKKRLSTLILLLLIGSAPLFASTPNQTATVTSQEIVSQPNQEDSTHRVAIKLHDSIARPFIPAATSITLGVLLFAATGIMMARNRKLPITLNRLLHIVSILIFAYVTLVLGLRWYISGHVPMVGGYSVMMLMAWIVSIVMILFYRIPIIQPVGFILAGFTMLVASLALSDSQIDHLTPVLNSPLLSIHVLCMMVSYTLFGLMALIGIMGLFICDREAQSTLRDISTVILYPGVFILTAGIFLGAVWANISWGNYWSWDPKETWALITLLIYSFMFHRRSISLFDNSRFFHVYSIVAFASVLITYFGVNLILGGMHSYA